MPEWLPGCTAVQAEGQLKHGARFKVRFGTRLTEFEIADFAPPNTFGGTTPAYGLEDVLSTRFHRRIYVSHRQRRVGTALPQRLGAGSAATDAAGAAPPKAILQNLQRLLSPKHDRPSVALTSRRLGL